MSRLVLDETLMDSVIEGTIKGLEMTGIEPKPIGASSYLSAQRTYSVLVSLYGRRSGTLTLNFTDHAVRFLVAEMLGEDMADELDDESFDALCEIGNIVAGSIKTVLQNSEFQFDNISLPALIVGSNYGLYQLKGITTVAVEFQIEEIGVAHLKDRYFTAAISMMEI
ncbi:MAG: chemotaxis protein CheX [Deltaproteobacteria bacterium]|nr:chemotaxis protein CheX [Deltaproteobacteria bacterium]